MPDISALGIKVISTGIVKTTSELDKFALSAKKAGQAASKPINVKASGPSAKVLGELRAMEKALASVRAATRAGIAVRITSAGNAKAISDISKLAATLTSARASARSPISVRVASAGNAKAISDIARMGTALRDARAAARNPINVKVTANGVGAAVTEINRFTTAINRARAASNSPVRSQVGNTGGGIGGSAPTAGDIGATKGMTGAVLGLAAAYLSLRSIVSGGKIYASLVDESKMLTAQLKLATSETGSFAQAQKDVRAIAAETRGDLGATATLYGKLMLNSRELGITQLEAARATETVTKAFKVSGSNAVETAQGTRQLVQALQSGVLRGDEFNTMSEAAPRLQKLLADSLGVSTGALREMAANGELTSEKLTRAFTDKKFTESLDKEFAQLPVTFDDAMGQIYNAAVLTFGAFDEGGQFSKSITQFLIGGTQGMADMEASATSLGQEVAVQLAGIVSFLQQVKSSVDVVVSAWEYWKATAVGSAVTGWLGDVISQVAELASWLNPISALMNVIDRTGAAARAAKDRELTANRVNNMANAALGWNGAADYLNQEKAITRVTAATGKATKARKGLSDAEREAKKVADEAKRDYEQKVKAADDYIESLQRENAEFGKSAKEIRLMEVARRKEAAATDAQRAAIQAASDVRESNIGVKELSEEAEKRDKILKQQEHEIRLITDVTAAQKEAGDARLAALKGLSGDALEDELARISNEYEIQTIWLRAQADAALDAANATHILARAQAEIAQVRQAQGRDTTEADMKRNRAYAIAAAHDIADIIGGGIGRAANVLLNVVKEIDATLFDTTTKMGKVFLAFSQGAAIGGSVGGFTGSSQGGAIGGGLGGAAFEKFAGEGLKKALGAFGGPLAGIAGGLIGGLIGGLLKKTPKASATISIIAGEAMDTAISGNKAKLKAAAGQMADSVISGLTDLAAALGAELTGDAKVSIGMRGKNYRVDPTGAGRTKGAGVIDFGEDQAAAIAYALQDAIKDGVLSGLGESLNKLIQGDGDLQKQLEKALSFKSVFDDLQKMKDPQGSDLAGLDKWRAAMDKIFAEAGATAEELAKLEELTGLKRAEIVAKYAEEAATKAKEYRELEIQIMELEGKSVEALAATRTLELASVDANKRALYERIYALQDEAALAEKAKAIADERYDLEGQLLALQGNTVALREREREAINPLNRDIYDMIQAMTDWAAQVEKSKGLFASQTGLESEILGLKGQVTGDPVYAARALQLIREQELRTAEASLRPFLLLKYAMEDQVTEAEKLAEAEQKLADSRKAATDEMASLQRQWLEATGDTQGIRALDLAALLSDDARALQQKIWDYTDAKDRQAAADEAAAKAADDAAKAAQDYADALASAQDVLRQAFDRQVGALQETIDKFGGFADAISEFRRGLFISDANPNQAFAQTQSQFQKTARMAGMGNEKALGAFTGDAQAYLDAAKNSVGSLAEYQAIVAQVSRASSIAERSARGMVSEAQAQIDLLTTQVSQFIDLNENVVSVHDAIIALQQLQASGTPVITDAITSSMGQVVQAVNESSENSSDDTKDLKAQVGQLTSAMEELVRRFKLVTPGVNFINVGGASDGSVPAIPIVDVTP